MKNYALDTSMLPQVWLTWRTTKNGEFDKRYWLNCQTEQKKDTPEDWMTYRGEEDSTPRHSDWRDDGGYSANWQRVKNGKVWISSSSKFQMAYAKYHPDIERLEVAVVKLITSRKSPDSRWKYAGNRFFICKDKSVVDENGTPYSNSFIVDDCHDMWSAKTMLGQLLRNYHTNAFVNEFKKFIGCDYFTIGNGSSVEIASAWTLQKWYETVQKQRSTSKRQKTIDQITSMPLSDCSDLEDRYAPITYRRNSWDTITIYNFVYFEKLDDNYSVLRYFGRRSDSSLYERTRVYVPNKGEVFIVTNDKNTGWMSSAHKRSRWGSYCYLVNPEEAMQQCPRIKYILSKIDDVSRHEQFDLLVSALRLPEIEQLIQFGATKLAVEAATSHQTKGILRESFGEYYQDKGTNLLRKIGLTKKQFDVYMAKGTPHRYALADLRKLFGNDLTYLDIDSFEKYFHACISMRQSAGWRSTLSNIRDLCNGNNDDVLRMFKNLSRLQRKESRIFSIFGDAVTSYMQLRVGTQPDINWYFDDVSDAIRAHDAVIELKRIQDEEWRARYNMQQAERAAKEEAKRKELDKERKQYEYEDDEYIIRLPQGASEIVREGSMQHICIGSYTSNHALGHTNLFFLRKKSAESVPFYAIEMDNNKHIKQIHGFGNRWLGNNPEAIPTVIRWLRKNGIKCDNSILTCKATGYGMGREFVPMPVVD